MRGNWEEKTPTHFVPLPIIFLHLPYMLIPKGGCPNECPCEAEKRGPFPEEYRRVPVYLNAHNPWDPPAGRGFPVCPVGRVHDAEKAGGSDCWVLGPRPWFSHCVSVVPEGGWSGSESCCCLQVVSRWSGELFSFAHLGCDYRVVRKVGP